MTSGETWKVRSCGCNYAQRHPELVIIEKSSENCWRVEYPDGDWSIHGADYIFSNYKRDY